MKGNRAPITGDHPQIYSNGWNKPSVLAEGPGILKQITQQQAVNWKGIENQVFRCTNKT
jgi:hypothetical protein